MSKLENQALSLQKVLHKWQTAYAKDGADLWLFAYGSLIWRPDFEFLERRPARVNGWRRGLEMWSTVNRGTPECKGLVFALLKAEPYEFCQGVAYRIAAASVPDTLEAMWQREMHSDVYTPQWLPCETPQGSVQALAFTLAKSHPSYCGVLSEAQYSQIFQQSRGIYGSTLDYARETWQSLQKEGIEDAQLEKLLLLEGK